MTRRKGTPGGDQPLPHLRRGIARTGDEPNSVELRATIEERRATPRALQGIAAERVRRVHRDVRITGLAGIPDRTALSGSANYGNERGLHEFRITVTSICVKCPAKIFFGRPKIKK